MHIRSEQAHGTYPCPGGQGACAGGSEQLPCPPAASHSSPSPGEGPRGSRQRQHPAGHPGCPKSGKTVLWMQVPGAQRLHAGDPCWQLSVVFYWSEGRVAKRRRKLGFSISILASHFISNANDLETFSPSSDSAGAAIHPARHAIICCPARQGPIPYPMWYWRLPAALSCLFGQLR